MSRRRHADTIGGPTQRRTVNAPRTPETGFRSGVGPAAVPRDPSPSRSVDDDHRNTQVLFEEAGDLACEPVRTATDGPRADQLNRSGGVGVWRGRASRKHRQGDRGRQ